MREIMFKGFSWKQKKWVYGYYAAIHQIDTDNHNNVVGEKLIHSIYNDMQGERSKGGYWTEVLESSVCQFTGAYDMNGEKIYDGDIIMNEDGKTMEVVWGKRDLTFRAYYDVGHCYYELNTVAEAYEVVGNILDNAIKEIMGMIKEIEEAEK